MWVVALGLGTVSNLCGGITLISGVDGQISPLSCALFTALFLGTGGVANCLAVLDLKAERR